MARHAFRVRFARVFAVCSRRAVVVRLARGFHAFAFAVHHIPVGASALRVDFARRAVRFHRVGVHALHARVTALFRHAVAAHQVRFARHGNAFARPVRQLSVGTAALFVLAARHAFRAFRSAVLAEVPRRAVVVRYAHIRSAAVPVRERPRGTRIVAVVVVGAGHAFARVRAVERIAFAAGFLFLTVTAARPVGIRFARTVAFVVGCVVFGTGFARTVAADVLSLGTADVRGTNASPVRTEDFFAVAVALRPRRAGFAAAVDAFFVRAARRFRAFAGVRVIVDFAVGRFAGTRRRRADVFAFAVNAFLRRQTVRIRRTNVQFGTLARGRSRAFGGFAVAQLYTFRDSKRRGVI